MDHAQGENMTKQTVLGWLQVHVELSYKLHNQIYMEITAN